jgi:Ca2+-binding EF-hand superfamily protein
LLQVEKLEQHCQSTFAMTRAFKLFDRDMSSTIDTEEMRQVAIPTSKLAPLH